MKKFNELGKKAEILIEQGQEINQQLQTHMSNVNQAISRVAMARRNLAQANELDEEGNPIGDVESAKEMLYLEENQLITARQELANVQRTATQIREAQNSHVKEIDTHNQIERLNLEKLKQLRSEMFGANSESLSEGMVKRLNEAEDARVKLLKSMGIDVVPEYVSLAAEGHLEMPNNSQNENRKNLTSFDTKISAPVGGGLSSLNNLSAHVSNNDPILESELRISKLKQDQDLLKQYRTELMTAMNDERGKVLSYKEKKINGEAYIDKMMDVYRMNLIDKGVVSGPALDKTIKELKKSYLLELNKDIQGQENQLYDDPNYDVLIEFASKNLPPIADIFPGKAMTFDEADSGHVNSLYEKGTGYDINCQSCVVVFEARERGYDVQTLPNLKGSMAERLSYETRLAWIDPKTGKHPDYIYDDSRRTADSYYDFIDQTIKPGQRYTIEFAWKGRKSTGHIVNIDRLSNGALRIKDNQLSTDKKTEHIGEVGILNYLDEIKYEHKNLLGGKTPCVPRMIRIDNMDFDYDVVSQIMKGS